MPLLDSIFAGQNGVANSLLNLLGGNAAIIITGKGTFYNEATDDYYQEEDQRFDVAFAKESLSKVPYNIIGGVYIEAGDLVGLIPNTEQPIRENVDRLLRNNVEYLIVATEPVSSGNETAAIKLLCRKAK